MPFSEAIATASRIVSETQASVAGSPICSSWWFRDEAACSAQKRAVADLHRYLEAARERAATWSPDSPTAQSDSEFILERLELIVSSAHYHSTLAKSISWPAFREQVAKDVGRRIAAATSAVATAAGQGVSGFFQNLSVGGWVAVGVAALAILGLPQPQRIRLRSGRFG